MPRVTPPSVSLARLEPPPQPPAFEDLPGLGDLCRNFTQATGWPLRYVRQLKPGVELLWHVPLCPELDASPGYLRIDLGNASSLDDLRRRIPLEAAEKLATSIGTQLQRQWELSIALYDREAHLATGVPVIARSNDGPKLANRLQSILESAARSLGCYAAAIYLLDEGTTQLKMRSAFGLSADRLALPARPLAPALADLEAMLGHAVVLESPEIFSRWGVPETCNSAICVPISSPTVPLGTMWVFNHEARDYTDQEVNLCEIVSGRVAAELERESVINEQANNKAENKKASIINGTLQGAFPSGPSIAPIVSGWNIAGWSAQASNIGGAFHDWMMLPDGRLAIWVGDGCDGGLAGAMAAGTLRGLMRYSIEQMTANGGPQCDIATLLRRCHTTLSGLSAGDHWVGMALLVIDPINGETQVISTGRPLALHVTDQNRWTGLNASFLRDDYRLIKAEKTPLWPETIAPKNTPNPRGIDRPSTQKPTEQVPANPKKSSERDALFSEISNSNPPIAAPSKLIWNNWLRPTTPLGIGERPELFQDRKLLLPGDLLLGMNRGMADLTDRSGKPIDLQKLLAGLNLEEMTSADMILELIQRSLSDNGFDLSRNDLATIVIQRGIN